MLALPFLVHLCYNCLATHTDLGAQVISAAALLFVFLTYSIVIIALFNRWALPWPCAWQQRLPCWRAFFYGHSMRLQSLRQRVRRLAFVPQAWRRAILLERLQIPSIHNQHGKDLSAMRKGLFVAAS